VDVQALDCEFFVCSAHKMYGPTGMGLIYGKEQWLEQLPPAQGGGEMIEHVSFAKTTYNTLPYKFEAGTPDFIGSVAFAAAADYIDAIGREAIMREEDGLTRYCEECLSAIDGVRVYALGQRKAGVVSFNVYRSDGALIHPFDVGTLLDRQGVAVRTGHHCAEPVMTRFGIPGTVRASFALYNTLEEVEVLVNAVKKAALMLR
jgi:cysteine desulfurase/selenocysteine lyase